MSFPYFVVAPNGDIYECSALIRGVVQRHCKNTGELMHCPMNSQRLHHEAMFFGRYLYVIGGTNDSRAQMERYDPESNKWANINSAPNELRKKFGFTACNGKIYIAGGRDRISNEILRTVEAFDPDTRNWEYVASMNSARYNFKLEYDATNNKLRAIGGESNDEFVPPIEEYDFTANTLWSSQQNETIEPLKPIKCIEVICKHAQSGHTLLASNMYNTLFNLFLDNRNRVNNHIEKAVYVKEKDICNIQNNIRPVRFLINRNVYSVATIVSRTKTVIHPGRGEVRYSITLKLALVEN